MLLLVMLDYVLVWMRIIRLIHCRGDPISRACQPGMTPLNLQALCRLLPAELHEIEWEEARSMGPLPFFMSLKDLVRSLACTEGSHGEARMH